ncbi:CheR family methyltransferase [Shewanella glacialimarina]|jgi:chemotaxis protein methyltransferase CheR|uniref:CheR family methyltransferase n=1 Tax=Shewanella glacialimarina TaxID=2590884 RepID=UPI001CF83E3D|nr:CheR family methyltransferase [Shewanella glacialimarina]UCX04555.1 chemotaxis protein CheR [Shewanella glacialimarina]
MTSSEGWDNREFSFAKADFDSVRTLLYQLTGIRLADSKDSMVYSRLARRVRSLKLQGFSQYLHHLNTHPCEEEHFINALTTNLTSFFREPHHFDILKKYLIAHPKTRTIWCAASSTGEEPYSIAMVVAETFAMFDVPIKIIASDVDSQVLQKAKAGIYSIDRINSLAEERKKQFFFKGKGAFTGMVKVVPELQKMVEFRQINLLKSEWSLREPIDIIFCRNVMIYFDRSTQLKVLERMVKLLPADGLYVAGHSETFNNATHLVRSAGNTTYYPNHSVR